MMADQDAQFSARAGALYDAALDPARWPDAIAGVADAIRPDTGACLFVERAPGDYALVLPVRFHAAAVAGFAGHYAALDPLHPALRAAAPGVVVHSAALHTAAQQSRSEFYVDFAWPHDMRECLGVVLGREPGAVTKLQCIAPRCAPPFGPAARRALALFGPHVGRAVRTATRLAALGAERDGARGALENLADGVILADASGRVAYANRAAEAVLAAGDALAVERDRAGTRGHLRAVAPGDTGALRRMIATAAATGRGRLVPGAKPGGSLAIPRAGRAALEVQVAPFRTPAWGADVHVPWAADASRGRHAAGAPAVIIVVSGPGQARTRDATTRSGAGPRRSTLAGPAAANLTAREREVAALLAARRTNGEIAAALGVSSHTARHHTARVLEKLGVTSRRAVAGKLADAPAPTHLLRAL